MRIVLLTLAAFPLLAAAPAHSPPGTPISLQAQPGTPLDQAARRLAADDLAAAAEHGDKPLVVIGTAALGGERPALLVQLQSPRECGSAGCTTSVYMWERGAWVRVLDGATGRLAIASTRTRGRSDLLANNERYVWNGTGYTDAKPVPAVDLRPRPPRRRTHH